MLAAGILAERDWLWRWDNILYDANLPLLSSSTPESIVIVAVDEEELALPLRETLTTGVEPAEKPGYFSLPSLQVKPTTRLTCPAPSSKVTSSR